MFGLFWVVLSMAPFVFIHIAGSTCIFNIFFLVPPSLMISLDAVVSVNEGPRTANSGVCATDAYVQLKPDIHANMIFGISFVL